MKIEATFNGGYKDFIEYHTSMSDVRLRAYALGWTIVSTKEVQE